MGGGGGRWARGEGRGYLAGSEAERQAELGHGVALLGCPLVPLRGPHEVLLHPAAFAEAHARVVLRRGVAQMRGQFKHREGGFLGDVHASSRDVADPDLQEGFRIVELRCLSLVGMVSLIEPEDVNLRIL